jgi:murein tripeptide amidase MpaA
MKVFLSVLFVAAAINVAMSAPPSKDFRPKHTIDFDRYWDLEEIYDYMRQLEAENPGIAEVEQMGRTHEGVDILGLRVTNEEHLGQETLPVVFVTAGISARDWISVMCAVDIMHELVEHYDHFRHIVDDVEWFIIPVANPVRLSTSGF